MLVHKLTSTECEEVLGRINLGRLACARANQPYIVPISFYFASRDKCLYSFSTVGQKIEWMRRNPKVCIEADEISDRFNWLTVVVLGRYEEITQPNLENPEVHRARELLQDRPTWWLPAAAKLADGSERAASVFFRITIESMSGRRAERPR
jgi:nitroimidazol reductase NimA-like FMN-containing flavoprotein (pyridoxamine 5'-phosphate oxidase superfamily)